MLSSFLCAVFAVCAPVASAPPPPVDQRVEAFLEVAVPTVLRWEGMKTTAYLDTIASPPIWTICAGETEGVTPNEVRTLAECKEGLRRGLLRYRDGLHAYFTSQTIDTRLPATRDAAYVSFAWNVGIAGAGGSTATRRLNAGDVVGGCKAMTWWNKAGGRVIRGLVNRRQYEYELCMEEGCHA